MWTRFRSCGMLWGFRPEAERLTTRRSPNTIGRATVEKLGYAILLMLAVLWVVAFVAGMIAALPYGLLGLAGIGAIAILFAKVVRDRSANTEDDYYSKNVEK